MSLNIPNLDKLISHLEAEPPERFDMCHYFSRDGDRALGSREEMVQHRCGTAACIAGHVFVLNPDMMIWHGNAAKWLGLAWNAGRDLFEPDGFQDSSQFPLPRAIATLKRLRDRFLDTGEIVVDWGPEPGEEPAQPWAAPQAVELTPPALPAEITRFLVAERENAGEV